jgi:hypothetical protein
MGYGQKIRPIVMYKYPGFIGVMAISLKVIHRFYDINVIVIHRLSTIKCY